MEAILRASDPIVAMEALADSLKDRRSPPVEILRSHGYTHFYGLEDACQGRARLPRFMRKPYKRVRKLLGSDMKRYTLKRLDDIEPRYHRILVCSRRDVI